MSKRLIIEGSDYDADLDPPFALEAGYPQAWRDGIAMAYADGYAGGHLAAKALLDIALELEEARPGLSVRVIGLYRPDFIQADGSGATLKAFDLAGVLPALTPDSSATSVVPAVGSTPGYWDFSPGGMALNARVDPSAFQAAPGIALINAYRHKMRSSTRRGYPSLVRSPAISGLTPVHLGAGAYIGNTSAKWAFESRSTYDMSDDPAVGYGADDSIVGSPMLAVARADFVNNSRSLSIDGAEVVQDAPFADAAEAGRPAAFFPAATLTFGIGDAAVAGAACQVHVWESWVLKLSGNVADDDADIAAISGVIRAHNPQLP